MNNIELAQRVNRCRHWLTNYESGPHQTQQAVPGVVLRIEPDRVTPFPSSNPNKAEFMYGDADCLPEHVDECIRQFKDAGVTRFFFTVHPCEREEEIVGWLTDRGLKTFRGTTYPTLWRSTVSPPHSESDLTIRRLDPDTDRPESGIYDYNGWGRQFVTTLGVEGFEHFGAFDGDLMVASSLLILFEDIGYLGFAATLESHQNRGGQSAMIAARVSRAAELGIEWTVSETLGMLKTSLGNLKRLGFRVAYKKRVFVWSQ